MDPICFPHLQWGLFLFQSWRIPLEEQCCAWSWDSSDYRRYRPSGLCLRLNRSSANHRHRRGIPECFVQEWLSSCKAIDLSDVWSFHLIKAGSFERNFLCIHHLRLPSYRSLCNKVCCPLLQINFQGEGLHGRIRRLKPVSNRIGFHIERFQYCWFLQFHCQTSQLLRIHR